MSSPAGGKPPLMVKPGVAWTGVLMSSAAVLGAAALSGRVDNPLLPSWSAFHFGAALASVNERHVVNAGMHGACMVAVLCVWRTMQTPTSSSHGVSSEGK